MRLHDRLLASVGTSVNHPYGPPETWFQTAAADGYVEEMKELIRSEFAGSPLFVFKDPRAALVFPLWRRCLAQLQIDCVAAIVFRNPVEVTLSLSARQTKAMPGQVWPRDRGGILWLRYVLAAERYTRGMARSFCAYSDLMEDWRTVVRKLERDLGLAWPRPLADAAHDIDPFLSPQLRHHHETDAMDWRPGIWSLWIAPVYEALRIGGSGGDPDPDAFDAVKVSFENAYASIQPVNRGDDPGDLIGVSATASPQPGPSASPTIPASRDRSAGRDLCVVASHAIATDGQASELYGLVEEAVGLGFNTTVVGVGDCSERSMVALNAMVTNRGASFQCCARAVSPIEPAYLRQSIELFRHLRAQHFDAILFPDRGALGYASIIAKLTGLAFGETRLGVLAFGPSQWSRERNHEFPASPVTIATEFIERHALENADYVAPLSQEAAQWMRRAGWTLSALEPSPDVADDAEPRSAFWTDALRQIFKDAVPAAANPMMKTM